MKKILKLFGTVFVVIGLSACGLGNGFQDGPSTNSVVGILNEQTSIDKESGTHFLVDESGKKTAVRSLTINLSGDEYLSNRVKALGMTNTTDDVFEITGISVEEILSKNTKQNKPVEYKDTDAGFRMTYFDNWEVETTAENTVVFTAPLATDAKSAAVVTVSQEQFVYDPEANAEGNVTPPLEAYFATLNNGKTLDKSQILKIGADKMDALKKTENGKTSYTLYRSGLIYHLTFTSASPVEADDESTFNKMIADFQFISMDEEEDNLLPGSQAEKIRDAEEVSKIDMDMTTFESLPYQFSGQYPAKWYYSGVKSTTDSTILHHYGFSDEASTTKELISLDVLANGIPSGGRKLVVNGKNLDIFDGASYTVYTTLKSRNFRISGPSAYKDLIQYMATNLLSVEKDKPL
ncbi:MAG: hypothetical protein KBC84_10015 [Proteobacteria bacterium]|nr:hypothetical protein [Pseudomonadota bacterium]